ncbi:sugar ABC transporter substrate-binding protein [Alkaliphilus transvaalensis]|uniref:sugar ABC transporter substrate-binding protein n=1 Tax=Alkaliphilus transvaalensis TaxID=114628 RepID=UPI00047E879D|nr:maltose ABC transporter substrate-binding protein [Alkaliphilus transvaalensis]
MKKLISYLMILVLVFSLTACLSRPQQVDHGDQNQPEKESGELVPEENAKLVVWESEGSEGRFLEYAAKQFTEKYGVEVVFEAVTHSDSRNRLAQDGPAGVGADVFAAPHDHTGELVASGLIIPNDLFEDRIKSEFLQGAIDGVSYQGVLYGYPTAIETYVLFYNKEHIEEAPKSFKEVIEFSKNYNNPRENKFGFMWDVGNAYYSHSFIAGSGGYVFGAGGTDKTDIGLNNEGAVVGGNEILAFQEILPVKTDDTNYQVLDGLFAEGKVAMVINGPWAIVGYQEAGIDFGIAPLPTLSNGKNPASFSGIRTMFVSAYTKYPNAAKLFADFVTTDEMLLKRYEITKQIPPVISLMSEDIIKNDPLVAPFLEQAQYAVPMPSIPQMGVVWEPYARAFQIMWNNNIPPQDALDEAVNTIKDAIKTQ